MRSTRWQRIIGALRLTIRDFGDHNGSLVGAAIAFYAFLAATPLLMLAITLAGVAFGDRAAQGQVISSLQVYIGSDLARLASRIVQSAQRTELAWYANLSSTVVGLFAASKFFTAIQKSLNQIWGSEPEQNDRTLKKRTWSILKKRLLSFVLVFVTAALFLVLWLSQIVAQFLLSIADQVHYYLPVGIVSEIIASWFFLAVVFSVIFKVLPDVALGWKRVWLGSVVTSFLFVPGSLLASLYVREISTFSAYGTAGTVAVVLIWALYSAQIFLFGAVFTHVWATQKDEGF